MTKDYEHGEDKGYDYISEMRPGEYVDDNFQYDVPLVKQNPDYPNGCEAASATMLLNFYGIDISLKEFTDSYLIKKPVFEKDGKRYGPDPSVAFAGDPADAMYGWGTLEPAIKQTINKVISDKLKDSYSSPVGNENKTNLELFAKSYQKPFIIWTTLDYSPVKEVYQWYSYDGTKTYTYSKNSHTVVVTGLDDDYYYINDPLKDEKNIRVEKKKLEESFDSAGRQAITIELFDEKIR